MGRCLSCDLTNLKKTHINGPNTSIITTTGDLANYHLTQKMPELYHNKLVIMINDLKHI